VNGFDGSGGGILVFFNHRGFADGWLGGLASVNIREVA
jgi:hypothetical protein